MNESGNKRHISAETVPYERGYTYFIQDGDAIKIGVSGAPRLRLQSLQTGTSRELDLLAMVPSTVIDEPTCHAKFRHLHIRGEWFRAEPELLDFIDLIQSQAETRAPVRHVDVAADVGRLIKIRDANKSNPPIWHRCCIAVDLLRHWSVEADYEVRLRQVAGLKNVRKELADLGVQV